jgi:hypothetical protein
LRCQMMHANPEAGLDREGGRTPVVRVKCSSSRSRSPHGGCTMQCHSSFRCESEPRNRRSNSEDRRPFTLPSSSSSWFSCTSVEHHHHVENNVTHGLAEGALVVFDGREWRRLAQARQGRELPPEREGRPPPQAAHRRQAHPGQAGHDHKGARVPEGRR